MAHARTPPAPVAPSEPERLITTRELIDRSTLSRSTLWRLSREDDRLRGAKVQLTPTRIGWRESAVSAWMRSLSEPA